MDILCNKIFKHIDIRKIALDIVFYSLGSYIFLRSYWIVFLSFVIIALGMFKTKYYQKNSTHKCFRLFIQFLNQIHAHISVGKSFKNALREVAYQKKTQSLIPFFLEIEKHLTLNPSDDEIYALIEKEFPFKETYQLTQLIKQGEYMGSQTASTLSAVLESLYKKNKMLLETERIIFQKKLEQSILILAPLVMVGFLHRIAPDFIGISYESIRGYTLLLISYLLLVIMKFVSEKLVDLTEVYDE